MAVTSKKCAGYIKPYGPHTSPLSLAGVTKRPEGLGQAPKREQRQRTARDKSLLQGTDEHSQTFWQHPRDCHHLASFPRLTSSQLVGCFLAAVCARLWLRFGQTGRRQALRQLHSGTRTSCLLAEGSVAILNEGVVQVSSV